MRFYSRDERVLAEAFYGKVSSAEMDEVFLKNQGDYVNRAREWKRSQATKGAWRKNRHHFMNGIHRAMRRDQGKLLRTSIVDDIKRAIKSEDKAKDTVKLNMVEYKRYEFMRKLTLLEYLCLKEATYFRLEESYVDVSLAAEEFAKAKAIVDYCLLEKKDVPKQAIDFVLMVCGADTVSECLNKPVDKEQCLIDCFFS